MYCKMDAIEEESIKNMEDWQKEREEILVQYEESKGDK